MQYMYIIVIIIIVKFCLVIKTLLKQKTHFYHSLFINLNISKGIPQHHPSVWEWVESDTVPWRQVLTKENQDLLNLGGV